MSTATLPHRRALGESLVARWRSRPLRDRRAVGLAGLLVLTLVLRTRVLDTGFWIDDGISWGIASQPLGAIPDVLAQDGSPPLYYVLLRGWMALFGSSEATTYWLSILFAVACVPAAVWAGWSLFGERAGWACGALAAVTPFLTVYAGQARMYTLVVLLSLVVAASFVGAFVHRDRRQLVVFALALTAAVYTHNWALFLAVGTAAALVPCLWLAAPGPGRRVLLRDAALAFGAVALAFAPWLPTLLDQARSTGAPWSVVPTRTDLMRMPLNVLGVALLSPLTLAALAGWAGERRRGRPRNLFVALVLLLLVATTLVVGWQVGRFTSSWAERYVAVAVGPALLLAGGGLAAVGRLGLLAALLAGLFWLPPAHIPSAAKSNVKANLREIEAPLRRGDLVVGTQPELVPVLRYYLGPAPRYASGFGPTPNPAVMDWRNALDRLEATDPGTFARLLQQVPVGGRVVIVRPTGSASAGPQWAQLIDERTGQWLRALRSDRDFRIGPTYERETDTARLSRVTVVVARRVRDG